MFGIPGSRLDGREPVETTEHQYDEGGILVRSVTTREPEWTPQDRAEALAYDLYLASLCPGGCGQPVAESTAHWQHGPEYDTTSTTCRACATRDEAQRAERDRNPEGHQKLWQVIRMPRVRE